jgi:uncharacterized protein (DUF2235 family)
MINSAWVLNQLSLTLGDPYAQHYISGCWRLLQRQVSEDKCMRCEGEDMNQYVGQKYRVIGHILKTHLTLTDVPYYYSLCLFRCQEWNDLIKHVRHFRPHQIQRGQVIVRGRWTGEEAYRKINKPPVQLMEGTDFGKLPREEVLNRQVQKQKACIPTFGPVPLVEGTHTLIPPVEPTPTKTPSSTPLLSL